MTTDVPSPSGQPLLRVERLTKRFGGLVAVDDLSFEVHPGEIVGLIGPNGAGKTTAFNLMTGFERPTAGKVRFHERDITRRSAHQRARLGMVRTFQGHDVFPSESARRNVEIALGANPRRPQRVPRGRRADRADELLARVGLERFSDQPADDLPHAVSGLLGLAMAMALDPDLVLLDEPLAGVNQTDAAGILAVIEQLRDDGTTVVLVEHNMRAVMEHCTRIVVLHHGRQLAAGTPDEIRNNDAVIDAYLGEEDDDAA